MHYLLRAIGKINLNLQVQIHDLENSVRLAYKDSNIRKEALEDLKAMIELASDYNVKVLTIHPAYYSPLIILKDMK